MPKAVYEAISLGARYWFLLLIVLIAVFSALCLMRERFAQMRFHHQYPDAGMIGEFIVLEGSDDLPENSVISVPYEGEIGYLRSCDIVLPCPGVANHHLVFEYQEGKGLLIFPCGKNRCEVNYMPMSRYDDPNVFSLHHGTLLRVGDVLLRLRLFEGLDTAYHVQTTSDFQH